MISLLQNTRNNSNIVLAGKIGLWLNWSQLVDVCNLCSCIFSLGKILKMESKYQSYSLHFVFYTLSSGSCSCFAQSRQIDPVLPSFPYQNSKTRAGRLADCPHCCWTWWCLMLKIIFLYRIICTGHCFIQQLLSWPQLAHWSLVFSDLWSVYRSKASTVLSVSCLVIFTANLISHFGVNKDEP